MHSLLLGRARRVLLAVVVVSLAAASLATAESSSSRTRRPRVAPPPVVGEQVGVADGSLLWKSPTEQAKALDALAAMGVRWVRVDFPWSSVQHGGPDAWDWAPLDRFVSAATSRKLKVLALLGHSPHWARPAGTHAFSAPDDVEGFVRFSRAAVERYAPRGVKAWEVWNEPNLRMFWGRSPDATVYADMLVRTSRAIKAVDPSATVVSGGLAPASDVEGESVSPLGFLIGMYLAGAGPALDAVGMHPYSFPHAATTAENWNTFYLQPWASLIMSWFGDGHKKIWATEIGWTTGSSAVSVSEETQATRIAGAIRAWRAYSFNGPFFIYNYRDIGPDPADFHQNLGLYRHDGTPKRAVTVVGELLRTRLAP